MKPDARAAESRLGAYFEQVRSLMTFEAAHERALDEKYNRRPAQKHPLEEMPKLIEALEYLIRNHDDGVQVYAVETFLTTGVWP